MDGNRRWAKARNIPTVEGHKKGAEVFKKIIHQVSDLSIPHAIFYSFSSENWNRSEEEVSGLLNLFSEKLAEIISESNNDENEEKKVRLRFVGDLDKFSSEIKEKIAQVENYTKQATGTTIWVALSYGGRAELVSAVNEAIEKGERVSEEVFAKMLWTSGMPDPDLIIRTGGQQRLSNFLPWQSTYSELKFIDCYWPDFTSEHLQELVEEFSERQRNFGK
ncbi:di-trans,poly-cis-decaprenylcistransferase [Candidatus Kaiserbacteria bacterium]|nr:di-trans,poly-cis-decaprenylcistransferase [Candidatus Kaiserbacteria bacterium]